MTVAGITRSEIPGPMDQKDHKRIELKYRRVENNTSDLRSNLP